MIQRVRGAIYFVCGVYEDAHFSIRDCCFHILAALKCPWLPFIRQAEQELKPYRKHLCPKYTLTERLGHGYFLPLLLFILPSITTIVVASTIDFPFLINPHNSADSAATLSGYLKTIATVLATLTGLLLTVMALTIHVKTSNLIGADFLLNAAIRKRGFLPVSAFLLGTILTALAGMSLSDKIILSALNNYTFVTGLLSLVSLLVLFNLLVDTMQTLGSSEIERLLSGELLSSLRIAFRNTLRQALVERHFSEKLADFGFARYRGTTEGHPIEYNLKDVGNKIIAIDPAPLRRISYILKLAPIPRERNTSGIFAYSPNDNAAFVTTQPNGDVTKETQRALATKEQVHNKHIARLIRMAFIIQKHSGDTLPWQRLREIISSSIEKCESTKIVTVT